MICQCDGILLGEKGLRWTTKLYGIFIDNENRCHSQIQMTHKPTIITCEYHALLRSGLTLCHNQFTIFS